MSESIQDLVRRQRVGSLYLRGMEAAEITLQFSRTMLNPSTGEPYPLDVIEADIAALEAEWAQVFDKDAQRGRVLAELRAARRQAWAQGDTDNILRALKQETELLGLHLPDDLPGPDDRFKQVAKDEKDPLL